MTDFEDHITKSREGRKSEPVSLFSANGRALIGLSQTPDWTHAGVGLRLGLSEPQVRQSITALKEAQLITQTKRGARGNPGKYEINQDAELQIHGIGSLRISALLKAITKVEI